MESKFITFENKHYALTLSDECFATSLVCKKTGEECIRKGEELPFFSITEERPYNNEIKLAHPNKKTTFWANRVKLEGDTLIVGFETIKFEAAVKVNVQDDYISFKLEKVNLDENYHEKWMAMDWPPVLTFRLIQLPLSLRENFGEWLNVLWDEKAAINVLATSPYEIIDSERRYGYKVLYADSQRDIKLEGTEAALICTTPDCLMDCIDTLEEDFDMPRGVKSRRDPRIKGSTYWVGDLSPDNVDEHIFYAKKGGFSKILISHASFYKEEIYKYCNGFIYNENYSSLDDIKAVLNKIKAAGLIPGYHFLHTHIGSKTKYVTPVADYRLNLTRHFTLSRDLSEGDTELYVAQNPKGAVIREECRVLNFDGELIYYEGYTTEPPYKFTGIKRGYFDTNVTDHKEGTIGGILDISEYEAGSVYIDQATDLQDEVAANLAEVFDLGMEFVYFDGSEGVDAPYEFHVSNAQYRVYSKFKNEPIYCEGAAKTHFGWHMLAGGNAFDVFKTDKFKDAIVKYPLDEAPRMAKDFTQVDFGWWRHYPDSRPDVFEFGMAKAVGCDCPVTLFGWYEIFRDLPRIDDMFEVISRWEDAKAKGFFTPEQKAMLRCPDKEHILLIDENGDYELREYKRIENAFGEQKDAYAFIFNRNGKTCVVFWHNYGSYEMKLPIDAKDFIAEETLGGNKLSVKSDKDGSILPIAGRSYFTTELSEDAVIDAFERATII